MSNPRRQIWVLLLMRSYVDNGLMALQRPGGRCRAVDIKLRGSPQIRRFLGQMRSAVGSFVVLGRGRLTGGADVLRPGPGEDVLGPGNFL
jgi:hypothetical protein